MPKSRVSRIYFLKRKTITFHRSLYLVSFCVIYISYLFLFSFFTNIGIDFNAVKVSIDFILSILVFPWLFYNYMYFILLHNDAFSSVISGIFRNSCILMFACALLITNILMSILYLLTCFFTILLMEKIKY